MGAKISSCSVGGVERRPVISGHVVYGKKVQSEPFLAVAAVRGLATPVLQTLDLQRGFGEG